MPALPAERVSLTELAEMVPDGSSLCLGGSFLHRGPFAFVRALIRRGATDLEIIKQSPGYDIDLLCRAGAISRARTGIVAMEGNFGFASNYRRAIENHEITLEEHACATLTAGLRASAFGIPFQPCAGIDGSGLAELNGWKKLVDPYGSGQSAWIIPAIRPDFAIIHVNEVTAKGDCRVFGTSHWDHIMTRAARRVLVIAEREVPEEEFQKSPELTLVPHFMVHAFTVAPRGAWPGSCWPSYEVDYPAVADYLDPTPDSLSRHLQRSPEVTEGARA